MKQRFVVIDLETTGNSPKKGDKIIQIAAVVIEEGQIVDRYMSFVNPKQRIPLFIEQLTGITNEMVDNAPTFEEIAKDLNSLLADSFFVAHNVYFDLSFLQEEMINCGFQFTGPILDTVELARVAFPTEKSYKLSDISDEFKFVHENPHRADSDAEVTALLLLRICEKFRNLPIITLQQITKLSRSFISDIEEIFEEMISQKLLTIKQQHNRKDLDTIRSLAIKKVLKDNLDKNNEWSKDQFHVEEMIDLFQNRKGELSNIIPSYYVRTEQIDMMKEINDALHTHQHFLVEAGTGSGKTIGYLVPAILFSKQEQRPVIVSTYTTNLQSQMFERDIPNLKKLFPFGFTATILKGMNHYLCLQKFEQSLKEQDDNYDFILSKAQLLMWLTETETGDFEELNLPSGGNVLWNQLHVDRSSLMENPFSNVCFYNRAKDNALKANLIITNHSILLSDILREQKYLPEHHEIIIDEAHHFHRVAGEQLGVKISYLDFHSTITRLGTFSSNGIIKKFARLTEELGEQKLLALQEMDPFLNQLQEECHQFFSGIHSYVFNRRKGVYVNRTSYKYHTERENNRAWDSFLELAKRIKFTIHDLLVLMEKSLFDLGQRKGNISIKNRIIYEDFQKMFTLLKEYKDKIEYLLFEVDDSVVTWIEIDSKGAKNAVTFYAQPLQVSDFLADKFFANKQSVILTSATLTVNKSFSYIVEALGLTDFYPKQLQLSSPFQFKNQVKMFIPSDMPLVNEVTLDEYSEAVAANIGSLALITDGKILVLFTSYEMLKKTYQLLKEDETLDEFIIMGQGTGSGSRSRLAKNFRQFEKAILLGTNSFWEGIDFPGDELNALMIVRLPFASPEEPIVEAKSKQLEENGINAFYHYSLPEAVLRFKQGFGRLIRKESDKGILFVLDNRIVTTKYGRAFLDSIPNIDIENKPMHLLTHSIEEWMK
ncbi:ATP-dependent DNA helicase DinG [Metabacillus sediminilitoris]|uniref:3'-5' exonuclease DinG n=1 Tax=Metabacillus sediminilitoris TaxID=2567941 RepID=A0A4S4CAE6_9BACI|nr:ATP-dependent DNA helicase DinG [Metabacillus sediminilitoris]QGQ46662.1 ATP-dependent DNA helicase DinG [Metabacillus sediminilitoris]THF82812.1 ATP-dependent DNA helicase DinG [Metabacillus sediminilitoris]